MVPPLGTGSAFGVSGIDRLAMSPNAAMPSAHAAFAVIAAGAVIALAQRPLVLALAALYPLAVGFEIVATGNHFWLDAVAGISAAGSRS
jgi:membrane-associated phospholipid phosphatase